MIEINTQNQTYKNKEGVVSNYESCSCVAKDEIGIWLNFGTETSDVRRLLFSDTIVDGEQLTAPSALAIFGDCVAE